jgi:hypothetical protein
MCSEIVGFVIWVDPDHPQVPRIGPPSNEQEREEHRGALARIQTGADMTLLKSMEEQQSVAESKVESGGHERSTGTGHWERVAGVGSEHG